MKVYSFCPAGFEGQLVEIETDLRRGIPGIDIVGLPDGAVKEARDRIRIAIKRSGFSFPVARIVMNLSPAGLRKGGAAYDLALALSVLFADKQIENSITEPILVLGELQLSGRVLPVQNIVSAVACGLDHGIKYFLVPELNTPEACSLEQGKIVPVSSLEQAISVLQGSIPDPPLRKCEINNRHEDDGILDFSMLKGQQMLRRSLEIAASGGHHCLLFGPPGCGKTLSARCFPSILPDLTESEVIESTRIFSSGTDVNKVIKRPQFRNPHHTASAEGILGGGKTICPGEISYAHHGVLFLDEAPEFQKRILQSLREPLEERVVRIVRAGRNFWFPARFQLVMAMNLCPCGNLGKNFASCRCTDKEIQRYRDKIGGALMDRVDMRLPVEPISADDLLTGNSEKSCDIKKRVTNVIKIQKKRFADTLIRRNSEIPADKITEYCKLDEEVSDIFKLGLEKLQLSSRAGHSVLKISRTIADIDSSESVKKVHLLEAFEYRRYGDQDFFWQS